LQTFCFTRNHRLIPGCSVAAEKCACEHARVCKVGCNDIKNQNGEISHEINRRHVSAAFCTACWRVMHNLLTSMETNKNKIRQKPTKGHSCFSATCRTCSHWKGIWSTWQQRFHFKLNVNIIFISHYKCYRNECKIYAKMQLITCKQSVKDDCPLAAISRERYKSATKYPNKYYHYTHSTILMPSFLKLEFSRESGVISGTRNNSVLATSNLRLCSE